MLITDSSKVGAGNRFDLEMQKIKISRTSERFPGQESVSEDVTIQDGSRTDIDHTVYRKCRAAESVTLVADLRL